MAGNKSNYSTIADVSIKYIKDEDGNIVSPIVSGESVFLPNEDLMLQDKIDSIDTKLNTITTDADSVSFTQSLTSGTDIGTLTINGTDTTLYAPASSGLSIKIQTIQGSVTWPNYESTTAKIGTITTPAGYTYIGIVDKTANKTEYQGCYVYASNQVYARAGSAGAGGTVTVTVNAIFIKGLS